MTQTASTAPASPSTSSTPPASPGRSRLSQEQIAQYRREGYLIYADQVLPQKKFDGLKAQFESLLESLPGDIRPEAMDKPHFVEPKLFEWLFADEVLDLVEPIIGPDIALFSSHFICKPKGNGRRVPWHEDSYYWKDMLSPMEVVTVWLAIDPSTKANGCMNVIPRALGGNSDYDPVDPQTHVFSTEIKKHQVDEARKVAIELQPNQASLHDGRLMHGSDPNTSDIRRCGYTMRYMSTRVNLLPDKRYEGHQNYLARGKAHNNNRYGDPTKRYEDMASYLQRKNHSGH